MTENKNIKFGIRAKILVIFSAFSLLSLVVISGIIGGFLSTVNNTITTESEAALNSQIETNLIKSASENAFTIGEKIDNAIATVNFLAYYAENLFENEDDYGYYPSFNDSEATALNPELNASFHTDLGYGSQFISFDYSMYHLAPRTYNDTLGYDSANATVQALVNTSAHLDHVFKYIKQGNPEYGWLYMGFEEGLFRSYPWSNFDIGYDPTARIWYSSDGVTRPDGIIITDPYMDANGLGPVITFAKEVFKDNVKIGTIAIDLTIGSIQETIINIELLTSGYAFMIDSNGFAMAHPELVNPAVGKDLNTSILTFENLTTDVFNSLLSEDSGFETFTNDTDDELYIAFSKIDNSDYIVATVVPKNEAIEPVSTLSDNIGIVSRRVTVQIIIIIALAAVVSVGVGTLIAGQITKPVGFLTKAIQKLTKQDALTSIMNTEEDIQIDASLEAQSDEIGDLTRAFKGMLNSIRKEQKT